MMAAWLVKLEIMTGQRTELPDRWTDMRTFGEVSYLNTIPSKNERVTE